MTMTDEELTGLIAVRFGDGALPAGLEQVQRRGRQRRSRTRIAAAAAVVLGLAGAAGLTAYGLDRHEQAERVAAFNRSCQAAYAAEAAKTGRAAQLPTALAEPLLELRRGDARLRLYTSAPGPLRSMTFDCARSAEGTVSGRLSYGATTTPELGQPLVAYRAQLPDGTVAVVAQLRDPADVLVVTPAGGGVQTAQRDGMAVVWGPREALDEATLSVRDGSLALARDVLAITATFQEEEFDRYCRRTVDQRPELRGATRALTARYGDTWALQVFRAEKAVATCHWANMADDPDRGVSYNGPTLGVGSATNIGPGGILGSSDRHQTWLAGLTVPGTERVEVVGVDGTRVQAQLGDGVYLARVEFDERRAVVIMTTATTVHTFAGGKVTQHPR
ncbi:hypothetical protein [Catellatospora chokoriensis]|uniref:Uncharacterized protein n=1 Tax=Catellatospora chokoriensis TaxID=310353 RepID=A0A8J3JWB1_9ACTN|nr:hypothetical protein [Catellatospora chokoriensis]GIF92256.1 hypothetical protein Cch02nite_57000 [Catellatospora chokoriensis]